jgi:ribokinase
MQPFDGALLEHVDVVVLNEVEAAMLAGAGARPAEAAARLSGGARTVVATLGEAGGVWASRGRQGSFDAFPVAAVDSVGAGDCFCGALALSLCEGAETEDAIRFAAAAAALSVTRAGGAPSLPTRAEVHALLER